MAKGLMVLGAVFMLLGALLYYVPGALNWFGKLPGDIHIKFEHGNLYIPVTSMIITSVILTVLINIVKRL